MLIKKFVAATLKDATAEMKRELGEEAIILNTRKIAKGGIFNLGGGEAVEITAAIDEPPHGSKTPLANAAPNSPIGSYLQNTGTVKSPGRKEAVYDTEVDGLREVARHFERKAKDPAPSKGSPRVTGIAEFHQLKGEVEDIKTILGEVASHLKYDRLPTFPEHLTNAYTLLVEQDVERELAVKLTEAVFSRLDKDQLQNRKAVERCLVQEISRLVKTASPFEPDYKKAKVVVLVGPTGVGKTTTIAKLAAINRLVKNLDIGLVTADTYRIGAIEQLRTFATIAGLPMKVVYEPAEMEEAIYGFRDKDVIFVDTVGRSQKKGKEISELASFVSAAEPDEVHLVLNASTNRSTQCNVIESFKPVSPNRIIFSKLDEAVTLGSIVEISAEYKLPISYVTTGQNVPDDILQANASQLASIVFTGEIAHA